MENSCPSCNRATTGHTFDGSRYRAQPCGCPLTWSEAQRLANPDDGDDDPQGTAVAISDGGSIDLEVGDQIRLARSNSEAFTFTIADVDETTVEFEDGDVTERDTLEADLRDGHYLELVEDEEEVSS